MPTKTSVLVVSDDAKLVAKLGRFLIKRGYAAQVTSVREQGHAIIQNGVDIALVDIGLPDNGADMLCASAHAMARPPALIALVPKRAPTPLDLTAYDTSLKKPFSGRDILSCIEDYATRDPARQDSVEVLTGGGSYQEYERPRQDPTRPGISDLVIGVGNVRTVMHNVGTLEQTSFPSLLYKMFANQATGILTLHGHAVDRAVYFQRGEPVHAVSESASESLGTILLDLEMLDIDQLTETLDARREGESTSQVLMRLGAVTPDQLLLALQRQVYERTLACFTLKSGTYVFSDDAEWTTELTSFPQNPVQLISDGVDRYVGPSVLAPKLGPYLSSYVVRTEKFEWFEPHFPATDEQHRILDLIDGTRTVEGLATEVGGELMPLMRIIWALHLADMVEFLDEPRTSAERSADKPPLPTRPPTTQNLSREVVDRALKLMAEAGAGRTKEQVASEKVLGWYLRLRYDDIFKLLGVERTASQSHIEFAFQKALEDVPPGDSEHLPPTLQEKAVAVHEALRGAFDILSNHDQRAAYLAKLKERDAAAAGARQHHDEALARAVETAEKPTDVSGVFDLWSMEPGNSFPEMRATASPHNADAEVRGDHAGLYVERARKFCQTSQWREACQEVTAALELDPENPSTNILHAWIIYNLPYRDQLAQYAACRSRIDLQLERDDCNPEGYYYIARMAEDRRSMAEAAEFYHATLTLNPDHVEAQEGLERVRTHPSLGGPKPQDEGKFLGALKALFKRS